MRPFDPMLLRRLPALRRYLLVVGLGNGLLAVLIAAQAGLLADVLAGAVQAPHRLRPGALLGLCGVIAARAGLVWALGTTSARTSATVRATVRRQVLADVQRLGPGRLVGERAGELTTLVTRGVDALDGYLTGYLPQLVAAVAVPVAVLVRLTVADWSSGLVIAVTLPLIPVFGVLVGKHTTARTRQQWAGLSRLGGHFLDVVAGLGTLRVFGRAAAQADTVRRIAHDYRTATMRTLRVAFLSALVLELTATLSVALVAVPIGLRLLAGGIGLPTALLVLLLAPEAYLPLRAAAAKFHASAEGVAVLERVLALADTPRPPTPAARTRGTDIRFEGVEVRHPDRSEPALRSVSLTVGAGERLALVGPSGAGKSTLLAVLLGFVEPSAGRVLLGGTDLTELDPQWWRRQVVWVPQRPHLFAETVADNIRLGEPDAPDASVERAARAAALHRVIEALPKGYRTRLGERGSGLSAGQRQRIALARAFLRQERHDCPLLLLDEPTARLDSATEATVLAATRRLAEGRTTILVAHRPATLGLADRVLTIHNGQIAERTPEPTR